MKINKRGSLTANQIVVIVLLIASFAILLVLYWQFNWKGIVDKESCHNSVIFKASTPTVLDKKLLDLPLRCKTTKTCIVLNKAQTCSKFIGLDQSTIEKIEVKTERDINVAFANALYDCWWMMGEGKVDVFSRSFSFSSYSVSCVECSNIDFSEEVKSKFKYINGVYKFISTEKIPGTNILYADFLMPGKKNLPENFNQFDRLDISKAYSIMFLQYSRTTAPEDIGTWTGAVLGAIGGWALRFVTFGFFGGTKTIAAGAVIGGWIGGAIGGLFGGTIGDEFIYTWMMIPTSSSSEKVESIFDPSLLKEIKPFGVTYKNGNTDYCWGRYSEDYGGTTLTTWYALKKSSNKLYQFVGQDGSGDYKEVKIEGSDLINVRVESFSLPKDVFQIQKIEYLENPSRAVYSYYSVTKQNNAEGTYVIKSLSDSELFIGKIYENGDLGKLLNDKGEEIAWPQWMKDGLLNIGKGFETVKKSKEDFLREISSELYSKCYKLSSIKCSFESQV